MKSAKKTGVGIANSTCKTFSLLGCRQRRRANTCVFRHLFPIAWHPHTSILQGFYSESVALSFARICEIHQFWMVMHHHRGFNFVGMVAWIVEKVLCRAHFKPLASSDKEVGILCKQVANHAFKRVAAMAINNNQLAKSLMIKRIYDICQYGLLCFISCMHTERQCSLPRILRTHRNWWHHHGMQAMHI